MGLGSIYSIIQKTISYCTNVTVTRAFQIYSRFMFSSQHFDMYLQRFPVASTVLLFLISCSYLRVVEFWSFWRQHNGEI